MCMDGIALLSSWTHMCVRRHRLVLGRSCMCSASVKEIVDAKICARCSRRHVGWRAHVHVHVHVNARGREHTCFGARTRSLSAHRMRLLSSCACATPGCMRRSSIRAGGVGTSYQCTAYCQPAENNTCFQKSVISV